MDLITRKDLRQLVNGTGAPCVSFYLPTHRAGAETRQDPIRLKNLLREADQQLQAGGLGSPAITKLLDPVRGLLGDNDFWQHQSDGLAIFSSPNLFRLYRVQAEVPELAIVADQFHLKPLLGLMTGNNQFFVLALSQNRVRVFQATRETIVELESENMPDSLAEALRSRMPERQLQAHSAGVPHRAAIFHGHGGGEEDKKEMLVAYFRLVDAGMRDLLAQRSAPILLAAVDYLCPIYRQVNSNPELLEDWISGNPDNLTPQQLHEKAVPIAAAHSKKAQERARCFFKKEHKAYRGRILVAGCRYRVFDTLHGRESERCCQYGRLGGRWRSLSHTCTNNKPGRIQRRV